MVNALLPLRMLSLTIQIRNLEENLATFWPKVIAYTSSNVKKRFVPSHGDSKGRRIWTRKMEMISIWAKPYPEIQMQCLQSWIQAGLLGVGQIT